MNISNESLKLINSFNSAIKESYDIDIKINNIITDISNHLATELKNNGLNQVVAYLEPHFISEYVEYINRISVDIYTDKIPVLDSFLSHWIDERPYSVPIIFDNLLSGSHLVFDLEDNPYLNLIFDDGDEPGSASLKLKEFIIKHNMILKTKSDIIDSLSDKQVNINSLLEIVSND